MSAGQALEQPADERRGRQHVLEVVEHQQQVLGGQEALGGLLGGLAREHDDRQRLDDRRGHVLGPSQRGERDEVRAVGEVRLHRARRLQRQPRLAHPARAREGQQPHAVDAEAVRDRPHVVLAADRPVRRRRQPVRPTGSGRQRGQRREVRRQIADDELEEVLGAIEVLEPVLAEIPERDVRRQLVGDQLARGARDQHLPAVSGGADPRRAVHVQTDVIVLPDLRLAGVDAHPHAHVDALGPTLGRERPLRAHRGGDRVARPREGDEERVTLGVDLATVVLVERRPQQALMLAKHLGVAAAQPRQQPRRTLDVAEQERDGAARKLRHTRSYAQSPPPVKSRRADGPPMRVHGMLAPCPGHPSSSPPPRCSACRTSTGASASGRSPSSTDC